jgi:anaerobic selenocysteine-containing dehydrogenase
MSELRTHYRTCNLCEAMCGIRIEVENDRILSIKGDDLDPFSRGHICPKAVALQDIHTDPDRLKHPIRRVKDGWEQIKWEDAFDEVANRIREIQKKYGNNSVATYIGNPTVHNYGSLLFGLPFLRSLRTRNRFSATSVDQLPHHLVAYWMFGHQLLLPIPDLDRTDFFVIMGANPLVSNGSLMTVPDVRKRLEAIRKRGGKITVIDPRRTETASIADQHYFIRPGTDALFMLAILQTLFSEKLIAPGRIANFMDGLDEVRNLVSAFSPEVAAKATGIDAQQIKQLARDFAAAPSAVWYGRIGVSTQEFGALTQWLIQVVNIVTGNLDRIGGAMFTKPAVDILPTKSLVTKGHYARYLSRVRKLPEFSGEFPVAILGEEILSEGEGQIKALITSAGNPVLSTPNGKQLERAIAGLDFMVSIDFYINETTRHANIILPPTSALEHENYDLAFHLLSIRNTAKYSPELFEPAKGTMHDWEIFVELQRRLEPATLKNRIRAMILKRLGPKGILNLALRFGPHKLSLNRLKQEVHGVDLGPLQPCLPQRLFTSDKRIQLAPKLVLNDIARMKTRIMGSEIQTNGHLLLIGRRQLRSNNSWMHNSYRMIKGKQICTLLIHPSDAANHQIENGERVNLQSRVGSIDVVAEISNEVMPGVVSLPHGWGHDRKGIRMSTASQHPGASINDLTDDQRVDQLSGNAAFSGVPVTLSLARGSRSS